MELNLYIVIIDTYVEYCSTLNIYVNIIETVGYNK